MAQFIKANGLLMKIRKMDEAYRFGQMAPDMTAFGETEWQMDMVDWFMLKVMFTKVSGLKTKQMVSACILISTEADMKANGSKISSMAMELNNGLMEPSMKVNMNKE